MKDDASGDDTEAAETYRAVLKRILDEGGCTTQQGFNLDEPGLYWKQMPERSFTFRGEKTSARFKAARDRHTLLLGGKAEGELKLKSLLVYHYRSPRAVNGYPKSNPPVVWRSNREAWVKISVFKISSLHISAQLLIDTAPRTTT